MRRTLAAILAAIPLALGLFAAPAQLALAGSPDCGSLPELKVYTAAHESGLIGLACPQFTTEGFDANYGVTAPISGANDQQDDFKFYNPTSNVWCLWFYRDANFGGGSLFYVLGHSDTYWVPSGGVMPSGWINTISSMEFYQRVGSSC